jgi:hypothetical protein
MHAIDFGMIALRLAAFAVGAAIIGYTVLSAIRAFVLPRAAQVTLIRWVFEFIGFFFHLRAKRARSYAERDQIMALYAPISLIVASFTLLTLVLIGYMFLYWALGGGDIDQIMRLSGSSLLTLGNFTDNRTEFVIIEFSEAMLGMILVALLIAYLPTMYAAFTRRETQVGLLEVRAGTPPSPWELISRSHRTGELTQMREFWSDWQVWFAEIEESHTSLPALTYFRSPRPELSWVTAAGVVLDSAALILSTIDVPPEPRAAFCIRSGYLALRQIADYFQIPFNAAATPEDPISIMRQEFDQICDLLADQGVPLKLDLDQAWRDFSGWRVNYDTVLLALAALTMAPYAPWTSDRSFVPSARRARRKPFTG